MDVRTGGIGTGGPILGNMRPFEPGFSPKCTILETVPIDAYAMRYDRNLVFYPEMCIYFGINAILINIWPILFEKTPFEPGKKATPLKML